MYLLTGRLDEALALLQRVKSTCAELRAPAVFIGWRFVLGQALEQKGNRQGACAAYASVLARWGHAKPRSITADKARARIKALSCPAAEAK